jgi:hypothetical protein
MALICRATSGMKGDAAWRIPLSLFYIIPTLLACGVWFMPEVIVFWFVKLHTWGNRLPSIHKKSPRWLLMHNHEEEALESLRKLRQGRFSDDEILEEFRHLQSTINLTVEKGVFNEIFQGREYFSNASCLSPLSSGTQNKHPGCHTWRNGLLYDCRH